MCCNARTLPQLKNAFPLVMVVQGVEIFVFPQLLQRDERNWGADAKAFKPERWLDIKENDADVRTRPSLS